MHNRPEPKTPRRAHLSRTRARGAVLNRAGLWLCLLVALWFLRSADLCAQGAPAAPVITAQPAELPQRVGEGIVRVSATGEGLGYQWYRGEPGDTSAPVTGGTGALLILPPMDAGGRLWVRVTNAAGETDSDTVGVSIPAPRPMSVWKAGSDESIPRLFYDRVLKVRAGGNASFRLLEDGSLKEEGLGWSPMQLSVYGDFTRDVADVAAGASHLLVLKRDGSLWTFGGNSHGQRGGTGLIETWPTLLATGVARIAAGDYHSLFVRRDGSLWATGANAYGQLGLGDAVDRFAPVRVADEVVEVSASGAGSGFVDTVGRAWMAGLNYNGELGAGNTVSLSLPVEVLGGVKRVVLGGRHTLWLKNDGSVWAAGVNWTGCLGAGDTVDRAVPTRVADGARGVAVGDGTSFVIKTDGALWAAGGNGSGQLGDGTTTSRSSFRWIMNGVEDVGGGASFSLFLRLPPPRFVAQSGEVGAPVGMPASLHVVTTSDGPVAYQWYLGTGGDASRPISGATASSYVTPPLFADTSYWVRATNDYGSSDSATITAVACSLPVIDSLPGEAGALAGQSFRVGVRASGGALSYQWYRGVPGDVSQPIAGATRRVLDDGPLGADGACWVRVANAAGAIDSPVVRARRLSGARLFTTGSDSLGQLGLGRSLAPLQVAAGVVQIAAGGDVSLWVDAAGTLWGAGNGTALGRSEPALLPVRMADGVSRASTGGGHTLFIKTDDTLWALGDNAYGQLGDGRTAFRAAPVFIASDVKAVACGAVHSVFLKNDGSVWGMGSNLQKQIGPDSLAGSLTPVKISDSARGIGAGSSQTFVIKTDGTLWGAGFANEGALGLAGRPAVGWLWQITTDAAEVASAGAHTWLRKTDGTLWATGRDVYGRRLGFQQIAENVDSISVGAHDGFFLRGDALYAGGSNLMGEFGLGGTTGSATPIPVASGVRQAALGYSHALFLRADGTLWSAGGNLSGQLGNGGRDMRTSPTFVAESVVSVSVGPAHTLYVLADGTLWGVGDNSSGQLGDTGSWTHLRPVLIANRVVRAVAAEAATFFIKADGGLWVLGGNAGGRLGTGTTSKVVTPALVAIDVRDVSASTYDTLFIRNDDSVWGMGQYLAASMVPVRLEDKVRNVSMGSLYTAVILKTDNTLWSFGYGASSAPRTKLSDRVIEAHASFGATVYLRDDGSLWAAGAIPVDWGGPGNGSSVAEPVKIAEEVLDFRFTAASRAYQLNVLKFDGLAWVSGTNAQGQLGLGDTLPRSVATPLSMRGVLNLVVSGTHAAFLVASAPVVTQAPVSQVVRTGERIELSVTAEGVGALSYQWRRDGVPLDGPTARTSRLVIEPAQGADSGVYDVVVSLVGQETIAGPARVTVHAESQTSFAEWSAAHGVAGGPTTDPDGGSGVPALLRYAFKLPATGPAAAPLEVGVAENAGGRRLAVTFTRKGHAPGLSYIVEGSSDLVSWTPVEVVSPGVPEGVTVEDTVALGGGVGTRFLRVRVELTE